MVQKQQTLKNPVKLQGIGLHSGLPVNLIINPAPENSGIVFKRTDLPSKPEIKALYSQVVDTRNCTCLGDSAGNLVSTVEHIMSALYICGIDNALVEVDNQEIPIMDGSAEVFFKALKGASLEVQSAPRRFLKVKKEVSFADDKGNQISLKPQGELRIKFTIEFPSEIVGCQTFDSVINKKVFEEAVSFSRTFCEKYQVDYLKSQGLIKGGSLENAVVLDGDNVLNPEGFRCENECVNHKVLDAIGDLYTSGYHILGELNALKTGHFHANQLLKNLFADNSNYELV